MAADTFDADLELDVRGLKCPVPMVRLGSEIGNVEIGQIIKLVATDPACMLDVPAWTRMTDNELLSAQEVDEEFVLFVRRKV